ncbi:trypco2 family protein [Prosthecobacter sp.]|uniref:trypco2 family protein n=1 Tax=Prosthecobacter sp. TaxID=1965333 RepID=UPI0037839134
MFNKKQNESSLEGDRSGLKPMLLSELISAVKLDLLRSAKKRDAGFEAMFALDEIVIETEITTSRTIGAKGAVDFKVLALGAEGGQGNATKHKVTVKLKVLPDRQDVIVQGASRLRKPDKKRK